MAMEGGDGDGDLPLLRKVVDELGAVMLFEKAVESRDVSSGLNWLFIRNSKKLMSALSAEERRKVYNQELIPAHDFLRVVTTDPRGVEYTLHLEKWPVEDMVVLAYEWSKLVHDNGLQQGDTVQGWGYRLPDHQFRLALNIIKKP